MKFKTFALAFGLGLFFLGVPARSFAEGVTMTAAAKAPAKPVVFLDAGHGGSADPGVQAAGFSEAAFTLDMAKRLSRMLSQSGVTCVLSRDQDTSLSISARVLLANRSQASAVLSLHANYSFSPQSKGMRVFIPPQDSPGTPIQDPRGGAPLTLLRWSQAQALNGLKSRELGADVAEALEQDQASKRGTQALRLAIFRGMVPPVAEVECAFASNPQELEKLKDDKQVQIMAARIARGVLKFLRMD